MFRNKDGVFYTFCIGDNLYYTLQIHINADVGTTITKEIISIREPEDDVISEGSDNRKSEANLLENNKFSFEHPIEFRCITQAEVDILEWERQTFACNDTCKYTINGMSILNGQNVLCIV